jgi:hypothetical protein
MLFLLGLCTSCASALKKQCESTNWFEYGESVAKKGQRAGSDSFVLQCRQEEANIDHAALSNGFRKGLDEYCTPDFAYRLGRQGEFLAQDMCSGELEIRMKPKHTAGVKDYCQAGNGEAAGSTGKKYNQICPRELEEAFLPQFNKGRRKYLDGLIVRRQAELQDLDKDLQALDRRRTELRQDLRRAESDRTSLAALAPTERGKKLLDETDRRIRDLQGDLRRLDYELNGKEAQKKRLREELHSAQGELPTVSGQ